MAEKSLAIIGGGASATLLLAHMSRHPDAAGFTVEVYDRAGRFGKGIAYSTTQDCHLLNVRAANMSAFADDKNDFADWAEAKGYAPTDFVPRQLYGEYLAEKLRAAEKILRIEYLNKDAVLSRRTQDGYIVIDHDGRERPYTQTVLASGNVRALHPEVEGVVAGYHHDPWNIDAASLPKTGTIALIGSGLSAVDMILALEAQGYGGDIAVYSRNALLPAPHTAPATYDGFLTDAELSASPLALLATIRREVEKAEAQNMPWQAVIDSLRPHTNDIWAGWSERQRKLFARRLMTFWNIHRHRMAPQIADRLERLKAQGRLHLIKADVRTIAAGPEILCRKAAYRAEAVINCLGYRYDEPGRVYEVSAKLGPARFGELFETTAIPEIRQQAFEIAQMLHL